jgi:hypothetical protein
MAIARWLGAMPGAAANCSRGRPYCAPALVEPSAVGSAPAIYVGAAAAQAAGVPHAGLHSLGGDAFHCSFTAAGALVLTGGVNQTDGAEPRGTINAVHEYLRLVGFRWYTPWTADSFGGVDRTAPKMTAQFPSCAGLNTRPSFEFRSLTASGLMDVTGNQKSAVDYWWVANHQNGGGDRTGNSISTVLPFEWGGQIMFSNDTCTSSIFALVPPTNTVHKGSYNTGQFDAHPEWYSLLPRAPALPFGSGDGRECVNAPSSCVRTWNLSATAAPGGPGLATLCLSNPAMREYMVGEVLKKLRWDAAHLGGVQVINFADNDATDAGLCHCAKCVARRERDRASPPCSMVPQGCGRSDTDALTAAKYRGASGLMLEVGSMLKGSIASEFPDVDVWVQSYHASLQPPKETRPTNGVKVQFTTLHCNFGQPLAHPSNNLTYSQLMAWSKLMPRGDIVLWDYFGNFVHPMILLPNWFKMVDDIKLYASLGVSGVMFEGQVNVQPADLHELRAWVFAQLSWDATRDGESLINEFLANQYSEGAAGYIVQHMKAYSEEVSRIDAFVSPGDAATALYFTPQVIHTSLTALDKAIASCSGSRTRPREKVAKSIASLRASPWFLALSNWEALCSWTKASSLPWPLEQSRHASLASFRSNVTDSLGGATLNTVASTLAAMGSGRDLSCGSKTDDTQSRPTGLKLDDTPPAVMDGPQRSGRLRHPRGRPGWATTAASPVCPCANASLCASITRRGPENVFAFHVEESHTGSFSKVWKQYDWEQITTVSVFGPVDPEMLCHAHQHDARVTVALGGIECTKANGCTAWPVQLPQNKMWHVPQAVTAWVTGAVKMVMSGFLDGVNIGASCLIVGCQLFNVLTRLSNHLLTDCCMLTVGRYRDDRSECDQRVGHQRPYSSHQEARGRDPWQPARLAGHVRHTERGDAGRGRLRAPIHAQLRL